MARKLSADQLRTMVLEEVEKIEKDLEKVSAEEVSPDEYADTLEKPVDWEKALKLKPTTSGKDMLEALKQREIKAMKLVKELRSKREKLAEGLKQKSLENENKRLKEALRKIKES